MDPGIRDPKITDLGREQAAGSVSHLKQFDLRRIVSSPYSRTLQTASIIAESLDLPITVDPQVGEIAASMGEVGSPVSELTRTFGHVDFGDLPEIWWPEAEQQHHIDARAHGFRHKVRLIDDWPGITDVACSQTTDITTFHYASHSADVLFVLDTVPATLAM